MEKKQERREKGERKRREREERREEKGRGKGREEEEETERNGNGGEEVERRRRGRGWRKIKGEEKKEGMGGVGRLGRGIGGKEIEGGGQGEEILATLIEELWVPCKHKGRIQVVPLQNVRHFLCIWTQLRGGERRSPRSCWKFFIESE